MTINIELITEEGWATVVIADDGPGVAEADLPRLGDIWYQTFEGRGRGGSGLGLSVARWVAEQHGGRLVASNRAEGGMVMAVHLPLRP